MPHECLLASCCYMTAAWGSEGCHWLLLQEVVLNIEWDHVDACRLL